MHDRQKYAEVELDAAPHVPLTHKQAYLKSASLLQVNSSVEGKVHIEERRASRHSFLLTRATSLFTLSSMRFTQLFTLFFVFFVAAMSVMAVNSPRNDKKLDPRFSCADASKQAPHECLDFFYGLAKCLRDELKSVNGCLEDYWNYVSSFDQCFYDFVDCLVPKGLIWS